VKHNSKSGWHIFTKSCNFLFEKPVFLVPIIFSWLVVAGSSIYLRYYFPFPHSFFLGALVVFVFILFMTTVICNANILMLELVQQIETGNKVSFSKAFIEGATNGFIKAFPLAFTWAVFWFIIVLLRALTKRKRNKSSEEDRSRLTSENVAYLLAGVSSNPFSWFDLGLNMVEKMIRMVVFLSLPAIAWENRGPFKAFSKAFEVIKKHPKQFLLSYSLTFAASGVMVIPLVVIFGLAKAGVEYSYAFWTGVIVYEGIAWTLTVYLEQMSTAMLYLWHLKWMKNGGNGKLSSVQKPDLFDKIYELKKAQKA
jgi:hypothetical protein